MIWLSSFTVLFLVFSQHATVQASHTKTSLWLDQKKSQAFMKCVVQKIAISPDFPQQEKEDLESVVETMMTAISSLATRGSSQAQIQAINVALASSLAELVFAEDIGNAQAIEIKTNTLVQGLQLCFKNVVGVVDRRFITEIRNLIKVFTEEAGSESSNDINTSESYAFSGSSQSTGSISSTSTSQSAGSTYGASSSLASQSQTLSSSAISSITSTVASGLLASASFQSVIAAGLSSQAVSSIAAASVQSALLSQLGLSYSIASSVSTSVQSSISSLGAGASASSYASAIASSVVSGLASSGILTSSNAYSISSQLVSSFSQSLTTVASQYGISVSESASAASSASTGTSSTTSTSVSQSAGSTYGASSSLASQSQTLSSSAVSVNSLLSSPVGLTSSQATSRIQSLSSIIVEALNTNGFDMDLFANNLLKISSAAENSGLSLSEARIEALLEAMVSLVQVLTVSTPGYVNLGTTSGIAQSFVQTYMSVI